MFAGSGESVEMTMVRVYAHAGVQTNIFPWLLLTKTDSRGAGGGQMGHPPFFARTETGNINVSNATFNTYYSYMVSNIL